MTRWSVRSAEVITFDTSTSRGMEDQHGSENENSAAITAIIESTSIDPHPLLHIDCHHHSDPHLFCPFLRFEVTGCCHLNPFHHSLQLKHLHET